jgi:hypothetical protein
MEMENNKQVKKNVKSRFLGQKNSQLQLIVKHSQKRKKQYPEATFSQHNLDTATILLKLENSGIR